MNEDSVRMLLDRLADTEAPPARVDIGLARRNGRRRLRIRRAGAPAAAALAVITIISVVAAVTGSPGRGTTTSGSHPVMPTSAPKQFNPMVPYASFGWLPSGFSEDSRGKLGGPFGVESITAMLSLVATDPSADRQLRLVIRPAGACSLKGSASRPELSCAGPVGALTKAAQGVNGRPTYWEGDRYNQLAWEYAPHAWALLMFTPVLNSPVTKKLPPPSPASTRALLLKVAERVRYGSTTPIVVPFQLTGVSAGWRAKPSGIQVSGARMSTESLFAGPAVDTSALNVVVTPAAAALNATEQAISESTCKLNGPASHYVTIDGASGVVFAGHGQWRPFTSLCFNDVHGLSVYISLDSKVAENMGDTANTPLPGGASLGGVIGVFRHLRFLGTDPANWTPDPLVHS